MFNKLGKRLRWLGEKVSGSASWLGNKFGSALVAASPAIAVFNPAAGAGAASAGMALKGVGALGDMGLAALRGGGFNVQAARQTIGDIRSDAAGVRQAYNALRGPGNPLERRR